MARTVAEIKAGMTAKWMTEPDVISRYELTGAETFAGRFPKFSIESMLFGTVAFGYWIMETLFDSHRAEVENIIAQQKPHTRQWYVNAAKAFINGAPLLPDSDKQDTTGITDEEIAQAKIITYASTAEQSGVVYLKVAKGSATPEPLNSEEQAAFSSYISQIKDAGVRAIIISVPGEQLRIVMDVYYDPMLTTAAGCLTDVKAAIREYMQSMPFNSEYRNVSLVDAVQRVKGVVIPELTSSEYLDGDDWKIINAFRVPMPGYFALSDENLTIEVITH